MSNILTAMHRPYITRHVEALDNVGERMRFGSYGDLSVACSGSLDRPERSPTGGTSKGMGILRPMYLVHTHTLEG
jgi:hypothetical protein